MYIFLDYYDLKKIIRWPISIDPFFKKATSAVRMQLVLISVWEKGTALMILKFQSGEFQMTVAFKYFYQKHQTR